MFIYAGGLWMEHVELAINIVEVGDFFFGCYYRRDFCYLLPGLSISLCYLGLFYLFLVAY